MNGIPNIILLNKKINRINTLKCKFNKKDKYIIPVIIEGCK